MNCPICKNRAYTDQTENNGELYVAEEFAGGSECFDPDIKMFRCVENREHMFYVSNPPPF